MKKETDAEPIMMTTKNTYIRRRERAENWRRHGLRGHRKDFLIGCILCILVATCALLLAMPIITMMLMGDL